MSFSFALDQLRFAFATRRTAILDHAAAGEAAPGIAPVSSQASLEAPSQTGAQAAPAAGSPGSQIAAE
jgi:hypothetical protein